MNKILFLLFLPFSLLAQTASIFHDVTKSDLLLFMQTEGEWELADTTASPKSTLQYAAGVANSQNLFVSHQQSLGAYMGIGLDLEKYAQEGVFNGSNAKYYDLSSRFFFRNKKQNYFLSTVLRYQKYNFEENGGLLNYEKGLYDDLMLHPVKLSSARNSGRHRGVSLQQEYLFNNHWRLRHQWSRWRKSKTYIDAAPLEGFYPAVYLDSTQTLDSTFTQRNQHQFAIVNKSGWALFYRFQAQNYFDVSIDTSRFYHAVGFDYQHPFLAGELKLNAQVSAKNNYSAEATYNSLGKANFLIDIQINEQDVPLNFQNLSSNHFQWNNEFDPSRSQSFFLQANRGFLTLESHINRKENHCYWNEQTVLQQWENPLYHIQSTVRLNWQWRKWVGEHYLRHQLVSDYTIQAVPDWYAKTMVYYESPLFEAAMTARLGFNVDYFTAYHAMAYMPALGKMYLQNEVEIGDYPLLTAFVETQIQSATIRLQARNISDILLDEAHFVLPGYPYPPMAIEFAVRWGLN